MFKVEGGKGVGTKGRGIFKGFNGFRDQGRGERGERGIEGAGVELTEDATGEGGLTVRGGGGIEFVEAVGDGGSLGVDLKA